MPLVPINYSNSFIYKLVCRDTTITNCYVGSTTCMVKRKQQHKGSCNNENRKDYNLYVYQFIRNNGGWINWDMVVVEKCSFETKYQLHSKEREVMELLKATLNRCVPTRTIEEYKADNKEALQENQKKYDKKYNMNNKDKISQKNKKYQNENRDKIKERKRNAYAKKKQEKLDLASVQS